MQGGLAEKTVLSEYHPDALDMLNVSTDLQKVLLELRDPHKRFPRQVTLTNIRPVCAKHGLNSLCQERSLPGLSATGNLKGRLQRIMS